MKSTITKPRWSMRRTLFHSFCLSNSLSFRKFLLQSLLFPNSWRFCGFLWLLIVVSRRGLAGCESLAEFCKYHIVIQTVKNYRLHFITIWIHILLGLWIIPGGFAYMSNWNIFFISTSIKSGINFRLHRAYDFSWSYLLYTTIKYLLT